MAYVKAQGSASAYAAAAMGTLPSTPGTPAAASDPPGTAGAGSPAAAASVDGGPELAAAPPAAAFAGAAVSPLPPMPIRAPVGGLPPLPLPSGARSGRPRVRYALRETITH